MRAALLNTILVLAMATIAGVATYSILAAPAALPAGVQTAFNVLWAMWPLVAAYGGLAAALWWVYGWLDAKWRD